MPSGIARAQLTGGGAALNPLAPFETMAQTMQTLNQVRAQNLKYAAQQQLGEIAATSGSPEEMMTRMQQSPSWVYAPEILTNAREASMMQTQQLHIEQQMTTEALQFEMKFAPLIDNDPGEYRRLRSVFADGLPPGPAKIRTMQAMDNYELSQTANIPGDATPEQAQAIQYQRRIGRMMAAGYTPEMIRSVVGGPETLDVGTARYPIWRSGMLGGPYGGAPGGVAFTGPGYSLGVQPTVHDVGGVPGYMPAIPGGQTVAPPGYQPIPAQPAAEAPPEAAPDYRPGVVQAEPLAAPPGAAPSPTAAPTATPSSAAPATPAAPATAAQTLPPARTSGGLPQIQVPTDQIRQLNITQAGKEYATTHMHELDEKMQAGQQLMQGIDEMRHLMTLVRTGPEMQWRKPLADFVAQIPGVDQKLVNQIVGGDRDQAYNAMQALSKDFVTTTMGQLRTQLPAGSRLNMQEWNAYVRNNPGLTTDPRAIERIFNFWTRQYDANADEVGQFSDWLHGGNDPFKWSSEWNKRAKDKGYFTAREEAGQSLGTRPSLRSLADQ